MKVQPPVNTKHTYVVRTDIPESLSIVAQNKINTKPQKLADLVTDRLEQLGNIEC